MIRYHSFLNSIIINKGLIFISIIIMLFWVSSKNSLLFFIYRQIAKPKDKITQ